MWLVKAIGEMAYIQLTIVEISVGTKSGNGAKLCRD
jgi:hypothetical protein